MTTPAVIDDVRALKSWADRLAVEPILDDPFPIRLTPRASHSAGRAALVFASSHIVIPADDIAEFGWAEFSGDYGWFHYPPHPGSRMVGWFRPPKAGRKYNVDFTCLGHPGHSMVLETKTGKETMELPTINDSEMLDLKEVLVGTTFVPNDTAWRWFSLASDSHWMLKAMEITELA